MRTVFALLLTVVLALPVGTSAPPVPFATYEFGLGLSTGFNNELYTCFLVKMFEGKVVESTPITTDQFVWQAQGVIPSKANPDQLDKFAQYGIEICTAFEDSTTGRRHGTQCRLLDDLWKLRFWEYPFKTMEARTTGKGWSEKSNAPSERQLMLLSSYGFRSISDLCHGEAVFRLLHDIGDPEWVDNYRQGY